MYFVYILLCSDNSLYTGSTNDPDKRFLAHKNGKGGSYTRSHKPIKIVYIENCNTKSNALKREAEIKRLPRHKKITLIAQGDPLFDGFLYHPHEAGPADCETIVAG